MNLKFREIRDSTTTGPVVTLYAALLSIHIQSDVVGSSICMKISIEWKVIWAPKRHTITKNTYFLRLCFRIRHRCWESWFLFFRGSTSTILPHAIKTVWREQDRTRIRPIPSNPIILKWIHAWNVKWIMDWIYFCIGVNGAMADVCEVQFYGNDFPTHYPLIWERPRGEKTIRQFFC